ncbi:MAG: hypothetical protein WCF31_01815 [Candidatus Deferrimicrobiaceae bacterium]
MKKRVDWSRIVGILMVGAMMAGCFVPIIYGGYKLYEDANQVKITLNVKEKPDVVFAKAAAAIEEKGVTKIAKRDDKKMVLDLERGEQKGYLKVAPLAGEETSVMTIAMDKGKDPEAQKKELVQSVMDACTKLELQCTEAKK